MQFAQGTLQIPEAYAPYIFPEENLPSLEERPADLLENIDIFIVEISDLKHIRNGGFFFQKNYFYQNFLLRHPASLLEWYRDLARGRPVPEATIDSSIDRLCGAGVEVTDAIETILRYSQLEEQDAAGLLATLDRLVFDRSKRWIFWSNFVIPGESGAMMDDRRRLAAALRQAAAALGATFFDPSSFFDEYDRTVILADDGKNVNEFSDSFTANILAERLASIIGADAGGTSGRGLDRSEPVAPAIPTVAAIASQVNDMMLSLHAERYARLGLDDSGLYDHYKRLMDRGVIVLEPQIAGLVVDYLPAFDRYLVTNAGLGELAFVLASCGLQVTACESQAMRYRAMQAGLARLREENFAAAARCLIGRMYLSDAPRVTGCRTLAVAADTILVHDREHEPALADKFASFDGLLVRPRLFLRMRETQAEQNEAIELIKGAGFVPIRNYPQFELVYFENTATDSIEVDCYPYPLRRRPNAPEKLGLPWETMRFRMKVPRHEHRPDTARCGCFLPAPGSAV